MHAALAAAAAVRGEQEGEQECSHCADFTTPPSFSFMSSPSELLSSINSINLAESIAKHKQWATQPAASASGDQAAAAVAAVAAASGADTGADTEGDEANLPQLAVC